MAKKRNKTDKKWVAVLCGFVVVALAIVYIIVSGIRGSWNPVQWRAAEQGGYQTNEDNAAGNDENAGGGSDEGPGADEAVAEEDCFIVNESENPDGELQVLSARLPRAAYTANGISSRTLSAYILTATLEPADVEDKTVDWSVAWKDESSAWASGKTVTDYVTITPTSDGSLTANAECYQAFAEQIIITATPRTGFENVEGTCTADYVQKILGMTIEGTAKDVKGNVLYSFKLTPDNLEPVIDFPPHTDSMSWEYGYAQYGTYTGDLVLSEVYTKPVPVQYYDYQVCMTSVYQKALLAGGLTVPMLNPVIPEVYKQNGSKKLDSFFFHNWVTGWFASSTEFSAFKASLRENANNVMLRIKCSYGETAAECETIIYNIKFSASSLAAIASDVTMSDSNIEF